MNTQTLLKFFTWLQNSREKWTLEVSLVVISLRLLMLLHISLPTHEREIPSHLPMVDTTVFVPALLNIMQPIIGMHVARLRDFHTVEAQPVKCLQCVILEFINGGLWELWSARLTCVTWNRTLECVETLNNVKDRLLVLWFQWPRFQFSWYLRHTGNRIPLRICMLISKVGRLDRIDLWSASFSSSRELRWAHLLHFSFLSYRAHVMPSKLTNYIAIEMLLTVLATILRDMLCAFICQFPSKHWKPLCTVEQMAWV